MGSGSSLIGVVGSLSVLGSTFSGNSTGTIGLAQSRLLRVTNGTSTIRDSYFGGLHDAAFEFTNGDVEISNTVINGQDALPARSIRVQNGNLTLTNSTLYYPAYKTNSTFSPLFQGTHIELAGSSQLLLRNSLLMSGDSASNTMPVVFPTGWDNTTNYPLAINSNNYISPVGGSDASLSLHPEFCVDEQWKCFIPNSQSTSLVDLGDTALALYGDGSPIIRDYVNEVRPQGGSIDIGALEKHSTLSPHKDHYQTDENVALNINAANGVLANDTTPGGISVSLYQSPLHGSLTLNADGSFTYQPNTNYYGHDEFVYDLAGNKASASIEIRSSGWLSIPNNQRPIAVQDSYTVYNKDQLTVSAPGVLVNDRDDQNASTPYYANLTTRVYKQPQHGVLSLSTDGSFIYTPAQDYVGSDEFYYDVVDMGSQHSVPQRVVINVKNGAKPGEKVKVGTSGGSISFGGLLILSFLALLSRFNRQVRRRLFFAVLPALMYSSVINASEIEQQESTSETSFYANVAVGSAKVEADVGQTDWVQNSKHRAFYQIGIGYRFGQGFSSMINFTDFQAIDLKSDSDLYKPTKVEHRVISLDVQYDFYQLWGEEHAPFIIVGGAYLNPKIEGSTSQVELVNTWRPTFGMGINLGGGQYFNLDAKWQRYSGDIELFALDLKIPF